MSAGRPTRRQFLVAYAIGAFGLGMTAQVNLLVPLRARELGASFETIGLIVAAGAVAPAMFSVFLGALVDRLGPRRAFILGTLLSAAIAAAFTLVTDYWILALLQVAMGGVRSLGWIGSQSYVTSIGRPDERAAIAGRFGFFSNVGPMIGPLLAGGAAQLIGLRLAFLCITVYALSFTVLGLSLAETTDAAERAARHKGVGVRTALRLLRMRGMQVVLLLSGARLWTNWVWGTFFPVILADAGLALGAVGTVVFVRALVSTLTAPTTGYWTRLMGKQIATAVGLGSGVLGLIVSPLFTSVPAAYIASILVGIAIGVSLPLLLSIVADVVQEDERGVALGLRVSVNQSAAAVAPVLVGPLIAALGAVMGFTMSGGIAALMVGGALVLHRSVVRGSQ